MNSYVICAGTDGDPDDVVMYGPFRDDSWAFAWIKQHGRDPAEDIDHDLLTPGSEGWEDFILERCEKDFNHWCENMYTSDGLHTVVHTIVEPGFDPTTLP